MVINTQTFSFDVANEKLIYNEKEIDLKKIIGSTNQYIEPEEKQDPATIIQNINNQSSVTNNNQTNINNDTTINNDEQNNTNIKIGNTDNNGNE